MVDDFEDADLAKFREWWSFDKVMIKSKSNEKVKGIYIGNVSLEVNGSSNNWYAGGLGTYLNENAEYFRTLKLVIFSPKLILARFVLSYMMMTIIIRSLILTTKQGPHPKMIFLSTI